MIFGFLVVSIGAGAGADGVAGAAGAVIDGDPATDGVAEAGDGICGGIGVIDGNAAGIGSNGDIGPDGGTGAPTNGACLAECSTASLLSAIPCDCA